MGDSKGALPLWPPEAPIQAFLTRATRRVLAHLPALSSDGSARPFAKLLQAAFGMGHCVLLATFRLRYCGNVQRRIAIALSHLRQRCASWANCCGDRLTMPDVC
jgi:hypothetical protein